MSKLRDDILKALQDRPFEWLTGDQIRQATGRTSWLNDIRVTSELEVMADRDMVQRKQNEHGQLVYRHKPAPPRPPRRGGKTRRAAGFWPLATPGPDAA